MIYHTRRYLHNILCRYTTMDSKIQWGSRYLNRDEVFTYGKGHC